MLHLKEVVGGPLNMLANLMTMRRAIEKCSQNEHIQGSLEYTRSLLRMFGHGRHPTPEQELMVDTRLSIRQGSKFQVCLSNDDFRAMHAL